MFPYNSFQSPFSGYPAPTGVQPGFAPYQNMMPNTQSPSPAPIFGSAQPPQQTPFAEFDWIRVNTLDDVKNVTVQPGGKAWIMLQNDPIFVVKTADAMGLATTQAFRFEPYTPEAEPTAKSAAEYAPMTELEKLRATVSSLSDEVNALKGGANRGKPVKQSAYTSGANTGSGE